VASSAAQGDPGAHGVADKRIVRQRQRLCQRRNIGGHSIKPVIQPVSGLRQAAPADIEHVGVEILPEAFAYEAPGHGRAGNARHDNDWPACAAVTQVMLSNSVRSDVGAISERALHDRFQSQ
jgi:hypothetical protein